MTKGEQETYRECAEDRIAIVDALKILRDHYARSELLVAGYPKEPKRLKYT